MHTICLAELEDAPAILALQKRAYESEARLYGDWTIPPLCEEVEGLLEQMRLGTVLKAVEGEEIVGSVRGRLDGRICLVGRLVVEPVRQGRGIGRALLGAIEAAFPGAEVFELFTGSLSANNLRLYRRQGYEPTGTRKLSPQLSLVVLQKVNLSKA